VTPPKISDDPKAPFGYDEDGHVVAPFGMKADGTPRLSNRGRQVGQGFGAAGKKAAAAPPKKKPAAKGPAEKPAVSSRGQVDYRTVAGGLFQLSSIPFQVLGSDPAGLVSRFLGKRQVTALRGDAAIITMFAEPMGNALGAVATVNPWLAAKLEGGNLPKEYVVLAVTASNLIGTLVANHRQPNEQLADMAEQMAAVQAMEIKRNIQAMREQQEQDQAEQDPRAEPYRNGYGPEGQEDQDEDQVVEDLHRGYDNGPGQRDDYGTTPFEFRAAG